MTCNCQKHLPACGPWVPKISLKNEKEKPVGLQMTKIHTAPGKFFFVMSSESSDILGEGGEKAAPTGDVPDTETLPALGREYRE